MSCIIQYADYINLVVCGAMFLQGRGSNQMDQEKRGFTGLAVCNFNFSV
jgi:hypothetical protein